MDWDSLEKPWSREECRNRYVQGRQISLKSLAQLSGVPLPTIKIWSKDGEWVDQRVRFHAEIMPKVDRAAGSAIVAENEKILLAHYNTYLEAEVLAKKILELSTDVATALSEKGTDPYKVQALASAIGQGLNALKTSIDGQRQSRGLQYHDINVAIAFLEKHGYSVASSDSEDSQEDQAFDKQPAIEVTAEDVPPTP